MEETSEEFPTFLLILNFWPLLKLFCCAVTLSGNASPPCYRAPTKRIVASILSAKIALVKNVFFQALFAHQFVRNVTEVTYLA